MNYKLDEVCDFYNGGAWSDKEYVSDGLPVLKVSNCKNKGFQIDNVNYLPVTLKEKYAKNKLRIGDVIIATVGSHPSLIESAAGRSCIVNSLVEGFYLNQNAVCVRTKNLDVLDQRYLGYLCKERNFMHYIQNKGRGAANQMRIAIGAIKEYELDLPDIDIQRRIAHILSAYDDSIENNQKQIKLLEEAAQRLYKEWFVDLRFPGYENCKIVDGIPEKWERKKLVDIVDVQYGYAFDGSKFNSVGKGTPIIRIRNIPDGNTADFTTEEAEEKYVISNGEILVGMDGEFHINSWSGKDAFLVQRTCCFRPRKREMKGWLLWAIYEPIKFYEKTVVGATVSHLGKKHIDSIELLTGPEQLYIPFQNYFELRQKLLNQNIVLAEARDRLLPKLMSGEIEV
ncbi:restriction endonuclease subunit S [Ruminococcus sp. AM49-8]|jgi:type I restriction enzyme S subunit|nr:restriction endonuclease subunit S [Ruminococcus sp. AM49-8]RGG02337.1 restriction endonuclease subunit S [Ruminococcus sp. AM49-10BH]RGG20057.1 restriction endonuclease subunit S [Ruminococcus sp. AF25-3LB]RGG25908.1 restriction endonuclease subunit S [Ruminococcus sp. AF25-17]